MLDGILSAFSCGLGDDCDGCRSTSALKLIFLALTLSSCTPERGPSTEHVLHELVDVGLSDVSATMVVTRPPVAFESGRQAKSCKEYLELRKQLLVMASAENYLAAKHYAICGTVEVINRSSRKRLSVDASLPLGETLAKRVDIRSFRSSVYQLTDDEHRTLADILPSLKVDQYAVRQDCDDCMFELRVVARVDHDDDGNEDWIIWLTENAANGVHDTRQAFIAYDITRAGLLTLEEI
jgi:hypothetical protein